MKKVMCVLLAVAATINMMAVNITAKGKITLVSNGNKTSALTVLQASDLNTGYNNGYCGEINMEDRQVAIYLIYNAKNYDSFGTQSLADMPLGIVTNADTQYKFQFANVQGTMTIYDAVEDVTVTLVSGDEYSFTAAANSTINDRFILNRTAPAVPGICHYGDVLQVTGSNGMVVKVHNMDDTDAMADVTITSDDQDIDISALTADTQYKVVWNSQTLIIRK